MLLELYTLGIFPQLNKHVFMSELIDIINKELPMVTLIISYYCYLPFYNFIFVQTRVLDLGSNNIMILSEFGNLHLNNLTRINFASNQVGYFEMLFFSS